MKAWYEVAIPREDILHGELDDSMFAADLRDVLLERGALEYRIPEKFFQQTYPTEGLVNLLAQVVRRLTTGHGDAVIQLQTPFGGGKTHALISLYHLFRHGNAHREAPLVKHTLARAQIETLPEVRILTFVGTEADALQGKTPWGQFAEQLGRYALLEEHDRKRRAPGAENLRALLEDAPTLILMDELAAYAVNACDFAAQVMVFCQQLTEVVKSLPNSVLVVTLPSSTPYGEESERMLRQLEMIFGRVQAIYTPVEQDEFFHVIRQRLFKEIADPTEVRRTVDVFYELYQRHAEQLPEKARSDSYRERMRLAYPFHPEVIDLLYEKWASFSTFQRTRGVLKLLGEVLSDLYRRRVAEPLILPVHINLANGAIQQELLRHIGNRFASVIQRDITGDSAQARMVEKQLGTEYEAHQVARGLATAIFFGGFSAGEKRGLSEAELRLCAFRPALQTAMVGDALHHLTSKLWYLHHENGLYEFRLQPNLNKIVQEKYEQVSLEQVGEAVQQAVRKHAGSAISKILLFPERSDDIPDTRELKLGVLLPRDTRSQPNTESVLSAMWDKVGEKPRAFRNTLVFLVADEQHLATLQNRVRERLAYERIKADTALWKTLSEEDRAIVNRRIQDLQGGELFLVLNAYRHVALLRDGRLDWRSLGTPTAGTRETLSQRVRKFIEDDDLLLKQISPRMILDKAIPADANEVSVQDITDAFFRYTHLPMVESEQVVLQAIQRGVQEGAFAVRVGERAYYREPVPREALTYDATLLKEPPVAPATEPAPEERASERVSAQPVVIGEPHPVEPLPPPSKPAAQPSYRRYKLRVSVPSAKTYELMRGVLTPLMSHGLNFRFTVELEVQGEIPKTLADINIPETLNQIQADVEIQEKE
ncbi:MAG: DUF499 domain-containing protein [Armatimonadetes bacterium]|nr:DUF499 domain-containing protein [Armatimonadota bacterium]CUU37555.1 hypothetical protein DCOP10_12092 [Armatimonadetes bacterium DC]